MVSVTEGAYRANSGTMSTLTEFARTTTALERDQIAHLNRLVSEWGMLADFCFSDLLLYVKTTDGPWLTIGQVRPATGQTIFTTDFVGTNANDAETAVFDRCARDGSPVESDMHVEGLVDATRMLAIPVRWEGEVIAVLQLVNAMDSSGGVRAFDGEGQHFAESLASQAAVALANRDLIGGLEVAAAAGVPSVVLPRCSVVSQMFIVQSPVMPIRLACLRDLWQSSKPKSINSFPRLSLLSTNSVTKNCIKPYLISIPGSAVNHLST
ncbi:MAG: GAF domain-containing protein [Actinobacteria bacterium]|nr:GAF domain-containing protein [Actinomycetota bacterium]